MKHNPYKIVQMFEEEIAEYTGSRYAVSVDSCTNAIFLCLKYLHIENQKIQVPKHTYLSVPMSVIHAGGIPEFIDLDWRGIYQLRPTMVYDSAKRLTSSMYITGSMMCLSFHIKKLLSIGKGGMILTNDLDAVSWFKKARYEGRSEKFYKEDNIDMIGWNMYMTPQQAAHGLALMQQYPQHVPDMGESDGYSDLTLNTVFNTRGQ
jgi:dTDP-4-amino-4,6-dideoxygalactose transaminase